MSISLGSHIHECPNKRINSVFLFLYFESNRDFFSWFSFFDIVMVIIMVIIVRTFKPCKDMVQVLTHFKASSRRHT